MKVLLILGICLISDSVVSELTELRCDEIRLLSYYDRYFGTKCTINGVNGDSSSTFVIRSANNFEYSKQIQEVEFSSSKLYDVPREVFATFQHLRKLLANSCGIEDISKYNFNYASELRELKLRSNAIKKLPNGAFSPLSVLNTLDLSSNEIEEVQKDAFVGLVDLQFLMLSDNKIITVDENLFRNLSNLTSIRLDSNKLQVIDGKLFASALKLTEIRLDSNEIATINGDPFGCLERLKFLNLGNNRLLSVRISETNLERLFIPYNKLTQLDINKNLKLLYAPYNELASINLNGNTEIVEMKLRQNLISDISNFTTLSKLEILDLSYNPLNTLNISSFARMSDLVKLNLEYTNIQSNSLTFGTFAHNFNLSNLDLSYNQLRKIDFGIFTALAQLTHLKIDGNNLTEISYENIKTHFPKLSLISFNDNDWNCTYLSSMIKNLKQNNIIVFIYSKMRIYDETNVDGIKCVKNHTQHIRWDTPVESLDDENEYNSTVTKSPKQSGSFDHFELVLNFSRLWSKIYDLDARIDGVVAKSTAQRETLTWNNNGQDRDMIIQSEVSFIKIILCFMCFIMSLFVLVTIIKFVRAYTTNHRIYFPSDSLRRSTATIHTTMEHVM